MANVKLTAHEMATVLDSDFILTKNRILSQVRSIPILHYHKAKLPESIPASGFTVDYKNLI